MAIAGTLGQGKLLVLHPAFRGLLLAEPFVHGIQRVVARSLKAAGRPTSFVLLRTKVESVQWDGEGPPPMKVGDLSLATVEAWPDDQVASIVVRQFGCRWGLVLDVTASDASTAVTSRLFEADDEGGARVIAEQS